MQTGVFMYNPDRKFPVSRILCAIFALAVFATLFTLYATAEPDSQYIRPVTVALVLSFPLCIAVVITFIQSYARYRKEKRIFHKGQEGVFKPVDYKGRRGKKKWQVSYAMELKPIGERTQKTYTTDYVFDINEYRHLFAMPEIRCRYTDRQILIIEPFPETIYTTRFGMKNTKFMHKFTFVWQLTAWIGAFLLITGCCMTAYFNTPSFLLAGVFSLAIPNTICAVIFTIYFFTGKR